MRYRERYTNKECEVVHDDGLMLYVKFSERNEDIWPVDKEIFRRRYVRIEENAGSGS